MVLGGSLAVSLCKTIDVKELRYFDIFFCSLELIEYFRQEYGVPALGTFRADKLRLWPFKTDRKVKKEGRGTACRGLYRTHGWYMSIFSHIDLSVSNVWLLFKREHKTIDSSNKLDPLKNFKNSTSNSLLKSGSTTT